MTLQATATGDTGPCANHDRPRPVLVHSADAVEHVWHIGRHAAGTDRPSGGVAIEALAYLAALIDDPLTGLTVTQQTQARGELDALAHDGQLDALREDPHVPRLDLPGRTAAAALRIIVARGLLRDEWDT